MANRSSIMGLHGLKNKTSRNVFDLSHRNLFTAKVGELLPCCVVELNPGDSVKINTSYFTRTAPLQSAAFTRLRENVQFFFVPYSMLWKYFDSQVLNMTKNASGGDISRIADGFTVNSAVTTQMPFVSYASLHTYLAHVAKSSFNDNNGELRYAASAKLLQYLGYGNFDEQFNRADSWTPTDSSLKNTPNLSIFRLLAYQKICNDHYIYRQWQPYQANLCNIDYLKPSSSSALDLSTQITSSSLDFSRLNMLDLRFSNLPLDYLNGVLPTAQFGSESVVNLGLSADSLGKSYENAIVANQRITLDGNINVNSYGHLSGVHTLEADFDASPTAGFMQISDADPSLVSSISGVIRNPVQNQVLRDVTINGSSSGNLSIIALRSAIADQRYKEIQLANDADFVSQIEASFAS